MGTKSFYCILQITFSNARDNCLSVYIVSVEAFCTTVKLLFLLSLVWLTETALNIKKVEVYRIKPLNCFIGQLTNTH